MDTLTRMPIKVPPYKHQQEAYEFALQRFGLLPSTIHSNGVALLMEMGTGKTLTAIGITGALLRSGRIRRVLVVSPLSITTVWREEFAKFADYPYELAVLSGSTEKKKQTLQELSSTDLSIAVVNYESVWRMEDAVATWKPDLIICD